MIKLKSALVSSALVALLAVIGYILAVGDVFTLDLKALTNIAVMSFLSGVASLIKSSGTTNNGKFVGVQVK